MTDLLKSTQVNVTTNGQLVQLTLGNVPITMDYTGALELSRVLRLAGKRAKFIAGDTSKEVRVAGNLTDANADELEVQRHRVVVPLVK